jgi:hypothetical protein
MLELLKLIIARPGIINIINVFDITTILIDQLDTENVMYRRELRELLKKFNFLIT